MSTNEQTVLVAAHPGHELRVFGWMEKTRPCVFVITDGSGRLGNPRVNSTDSLLRQTGATRGTFFGNISDANAYQSIISGDYDAFASMANDLTSYLISRPISYVVADAFEGYNPLHDMCRLIVNAAVKAASKYTYIANYAFTLSGKPEPPSKENLPNSIRLHLDDEVFARKMHAARNYPGLMNEIENALKVTNEESFRVEYLWPQEDDDLATRFKDQKPFYEGFGEQQVSSGHYQEVIRFRQHLLPFAELLKTHTAAVTQETY